MCTNYYLVKSKATTKLASRLGVKQRDLRFGDFKPASSISIVIKEDGQHRIVKATWWLYLEQTDEGLKPHKKYFSVNSNHEKLPKRPEYKKSRCIVPATGFVESQDGKNPHMLEPSDGSAIAFGGLFKRWKDKVTDEIRYSAAIITLKGHSALKDIHRKSTPLWLPDEAYDDWLDRELTDTTPFVHLLKPTIHMGFVATPIDKTMSKNPIGESFNIPGDI